MAGDAKLRTPVHPGAILKLDFLDHLGMSINRLNKELRIPANRLSLPSGRNQPGWRARLQIRAM